MARLTLAEQETSINYNGAEQQVEIYTKYLPDIEYYDRLCKTNPEWIECVKTEEFSKTYWISERRLSTVRLKPPKKMSEEEKQSKAEQLRKGRASKTLGNVGK